MAHKGQRYPEFWRFRTILLFFSYLVLQVLMPFLWFGDFLFTDFIKTRWLWFDWGKSYFRRFVSSTSSRRRTVTVYRQYKIARVGPY